MIRTVNAAIDTPVGTDLSFEWADRERCEAILQEAHARGDSQAPIGQLIVEIALGFLDAPYEAHTLDQDGPERLVVNLRTFDCVTYVENMIALACTIQAGKAEFGDYTAILQRIRYRGGQRNGYPSRLHYFGDWLSDNRRKAILREITRGPGSTPVRKKLHALTDQRESLPPLRDEETFRRMRAVEKNRSRRPLHVLPKNALRGSENRVADGDIIAVATDACGIDVIHTGIAVRRRGRIYLLHASRRMGRVVLSETTLYRYLQARRSTLGVIIGRVRENKVRDQSNAIPANRRPPEGG